ncbi:MAG: hypothetical protein MR971_05645 [Bacteroidales bacterium]|nr:hypothetical protein [Bacteroidales bacterium]
MKYFNQFTGFSALLLAGTMGFAACSSDDEVADVNPSYDGSSVKAQFSINIPANMGKSGRMSAGQAQQNGDDFLGMGKITMFPLVITAAPIDNDDVAAQKRSTAPTLGDIAGGTSGWDNASIHAKVYKDVQFNLGTNYALFYAEGTHAATENCGLTPSYASTGSLIGSIGFSLDAPYTANDEAQTYLVGVLTNIAQELATQGATYAGLKTLEETFKAKVNGEYKIIAGSSKNILAMAANLYASCKRGVTEDAIARAGYEAVMNKVKDYFTVSTEDVVNGFKTSAAGYITGADNYPNVCNVPDGSVAVQFVEASNEFKSATYDMGDAYNNWSITQPATYRKPSSLYYFVQTPVKTRDTEWLNDNLAGKSWNDVVSVYSGTKVTASTRSMILEKPVQYGVAALETNVVAISSTLQDEKGDNKTITGKLNITGIIIGGQKNVDWKFQPTGANEYAVYDKNFCYNADGTTTNPVLNTSDLTQKNYTLLLETTAGTAVNVAIEFENNMEDFYGKDHMLIAKGTKFYLLAKLNPAAGAGGTDNPGKNTVFLQDYLTTAKFTVTSLKNAYNIIPDLRSPKLEFGLSVDLEWQTGMDFNVSVE